MNKVCLSLAFTTLTAFAMLAGCSDDPNVVAGAGGEGGDDGAAGASSAGKASGGSNTTAGKSGAGGEPSSSGGGGGEPASEGGAGGEPESAGGTAGETTSAGAGGMPGSDVVYQCNDTTRTHKLCSALKAAACTPATDCADCVVTRNSEREPFLECAACTAVYDAHWQCAVDAFEGNNLSSGVECLEEFGADLHFENCYPILDSAIQCLDYLLENPCPETWPLE